MQLTLTKEMEAPVEEEMANGGFSTPEEVEIVRILHRKRKLRRLRLLEQP